MNYPVNSSGKVLFFGVFVLITCSIYLVVKDQLRFFFFFFQLRFLKVFLYEGVQVDSMFLTFISNYFYVFSYTVSIFISDSSWSYCFCSLVNGLSILFISSENELFLLLIFS